MGLYRATYFDGKSAADWEVLVRPAEDGLRIEAKGAEPLALWPYDDIEVLDEDIESKRLRLRKKNDAARLTVTDPGLLDELPRGRGAARLRILASVVRKRGDVGSRATTGRLGPKREISSRRRLDCRAGSRESGASWHRV